MQITTYQSTKDAMYLVPEIHVVPKNSYPAKTALELLAASPIKPELVSVLPPGTKVLSVNVKNHIAYADFNDKLIKNNSGGSTDEILLVAAIVDTLTEFPEIQKVQILVNGEKVDTINGHMDTSEPLSRSEKIIKK
jgi:germination protein M